MTWSLIPLLVLLALAVGLIYGIILWITSGKGGTKGEMSCGGCGYAVRGLESLNCPECGADLRMVGITRGQGAGKRGLGIALTLGCGALLMLGCFMSMMWVSVGSSSPASAPAQAPTKSYPALPSPQNAITIEDQDTEDGTDDTP